MTPILYAITYKITSASATLKSAEHEHRLGGRSLDTVHMSIPSGGRRGGIVKRNQGLWSASGIAEGAR